MKNLMLAIVLMIFGNGLFAQKNTSQRDGDKSTKKETKAEREAIHKQLFNEKTAMINSRRFVLEASFIISRDGTRNSVSSGLNFIMVDSAQAVVQSGNNAGMGLNDVGGTTASGNITSWKVYKNEKKRTFTIEMGVSTNMGLINMVFYIPASGNTTAHLRENFKLPSADFVGPLIPLTKSTVYKGRAGYVVPGLN